MQRSCNTTCLSSAAAPSRCLMMSLVSRSVGPVKIMGMIIKTSSPAQVLPSMQLLDCSTENSKMFESNRHLEAFHYELQRDLLLFLPMARSACCNSSVKAVRGTSSETGRTVTVERLEAWFPASHLLPEVCRARLRAGDANEQWLQVNTKHHKVCATLFISTLKLHSTTFQRALKFIIWWLTWDQHVPESSKISTSI